MTNSRDTGATVDHYFEAWRSGDFDRMRPWLTDDFTFEGPLMQSEGPDDYIAKTKAMAKQFEGGNYEFVTRIVQDEGAVVISKLTMGPVVLHTAEHFVVREGRIASARLYFDPTPLRSAAPPVA